MCGCQSGEAYHRQSYLRLSPLILKLFLTNSCLLLQFDEATLVTPQIDMYRDVSESTVCSLTPVIPDEAILAVRTSSRWAPVRIPLTITRSQPRSMLSEISFDVQGSASSGRRGSARPSVSGESYQRPRCPSPSCACNPDVPFPLLSNDRQVIRYIIFWDQSVRKRRSHPLPSHPSSP